MTSSPVSRVVYNGKRNSSPRSPPSSSEIFAPAHEENVRFIYEAGQGVERDLRSQLSGGERGLVEEYVEKVPNPSLKTFKPIDLSDLKRRNTQDTKTPSGAGAPALASGGPARPPRPPPLP